MKKILLYAILACIASMMPKTVKAAEAYAVLSEDNTTLTFYFDDQKGIRNGTIYPADDFRTAQDKGGWYQMVDNITTVTFDLLFEEYSQLTSTSYWFEGCKNLKTINGLERLNTSNVEDMSWMFTDCSTLTSIDVTHFVTNNVTNMSGLFSGCNSLDNLDVSTFNTTKVTDMSCMFQGCNKLTCLILRNFDTFEVIDMSYMFAGCKILTELDISSFNTHNVNNMDGLFGDCHNLQRLNLENFDTRNVTTMNGMFFYCLTLTELDLSNFDTGNVTNMKDMFWQCRSLTKLDLSSFDTHNVTNMNNMFAGCTSLTNLDISRFDTGKVLYMYCMFAGCPFLSLDISHFNTQNVKSMDYMFTECNNLTELDLSSFNTNNVNSMSQMFANDISLKTIYVSNEWTTVNVKKSDKMFSQCIGLIGGSGTTWDGSHIDHTYAHIDGGADNPGYLTYKEAGGSSGIKTTLKKDSPKTDCYNLNGMKLTRNSNKSIYIKNGKKYIK